MKVSMDPYVERTHGRECRPKVTQINGQIQGRVVRQSPDGIPWIGVLEKNKVSLVALPRRGYSADICTTVVDFTVNEVE